tara:strand:+ start:1206 stop:2066 length:861 start_codon:yes stop_codon:yes gene_type:complete
MMKKITLFTLLLTFSISVGFSQVTVNDFEAGYTPPLDDSGQLILEVVANPNPTGLNTSANSLKIARTETKRWWDYFGIDVEDMEIASSEIKYLSVMALYVGVPDIGIRFDASSDAETGGPTVRPLNSYDASNLNEWQELVFEIKDDQGAFAFTKGTLYRLTVHPDIGDQDDAIDGIVGRNHLISATDFAYLDQFKILDTNPLSVRDVSLEDAFSIYPSAVSSTFTVKTTKTISDIAVFSVLGKDVSNNIVALGNKSYDISTLSSGMYIVKIASENGNFITKKIVKE